MKHVLFSLALWACDIPLQGSVAPGGVGTTHEVAEPTLEVAADTGGPDILSEPCFYCEASNLGPQIELVLVPCKGFAQGGVCYLRTPTFDCAIECLVDEAGHVCDRIADIPCVRR